MYVRVRSVFKGDRPSRGLKLSSKSKRKPTRSSKSQLPGVVEQDPVLAQQDSTTVNQVTVKFRFDQGTRMI